MLDYVQVKLLREYGGRVPGVEFETTYGAATELKRRGIAVIVDTVIPSTIENEQQQKSALQDAPENKAFLGAPENKGIPLPGKSARKRRRLFGLDD